MNTRSSPNPARLPLDPTPRRRHGQAQAGAALLMLALGLFTARPASADVTDIANVPLGTATITAKPNVMFILDDSGSMGWDFMPDEMDPEAGTCNSGGNGNCYGYRAAQCNGVAFDPTEDYPLPIKADGTFYPNINFSAALDDGYDTGSGTVDLSTRDTYYRYTGTQPALNWRYQANGNLITSDFTRECFSTIGSTPGSAVFQATTARANNLQQKFANWYSYYRKRYLLMRSAAGGAFAKLDPNYRVGFTAISDTSISGSKFLDVGDFNTTQRSSFFSKLYSIDPGSGTPLRGALSKVGSYYGKAITGQSYDPAEYDFTNPVTGTTTREKYQCQRNYAILSTDGYWNSLNNNAGTLPSTYRNGFKLDGSTRVGQQDGDEVRPMKDGTSTVTTTTVTTGSVNRVRTDTSVTSDSTVTRDKYLVTRCSTNSARYTLETIRQRGAKVSTVVTSLIEDVTTSSTTTTVNRDGVITTTTTPTTTTRTRVSNNAGTPAVSTTWSDLSTTGPQGCYRGRDLDDQSNDVLPNTPNLSPFAYYSGETTTAGPTNRPAVTSAAVTLSSSTLPGTPVVTTTTTSGDSNSLADIAEYYYKTDLRPTIANHVPPSGRDTATWQHMTTYTIGLGVRGTLAYDPDYLVGDPKGDYGELVAGTKTWPVPSGTLTDGDFDATHVDDLWHAAVNGRGQYFSAGNATALSNALASTLKEVGAARGTAAAAASSTLTPSASDDWLFLTRYVSAPTWNGDLKAFKFRFTDTGDLIQPNTVDRPDAPADTPVFSVATKLDSRDLATQPRKILFNSAGTLTDFTYANLSAAQKAHFDDRCTRTTDKLSQCAEMAADASNGAARLAKVTGTNLVNFINGDRSLLRNDPDAVDQIWRPRSNRLGDIVHSSPVYVAKPGFKYNDTGYAAFVTAKANRAKVVYVGSNDGMLHAFKVAEGADATAGDELWAFVPTTVIPDLWRLADSDYDNNHRYYVDATANVGDVFDGTNWRTILVSGMGAGGRSYFALDITNPTSPSLLWEFTDTNLGMSFGNPVITKNKNHTWVVAFSSGYNNVSPGDGVGRLYIRNAVTGAEVATLSTGVGSTGTPSNLGRINAWVEKDSDNTALRFYGGDMLGNMWRFDPDDYVPPTGAEATLLGTATTAAGVPQPITSKPVLSEVTDSSGNRIALVSFGTGRYLGTNDLTDATRQTIYTVKDALLATGVGNLHQTSARLVERTLDADRKLTSTTDIDWSAQNGWYVDLASPTRSDRERVYLDGTPLAAGIIGFASTVPNGDPCSAGGESWLYEFDVLAGKITQVTHYSSMVVGLGRVDTVSGVQGLVTTTDGLGDPPPRNPNPPGNAFVTKRTSWRELQD
ncbi:MAG: hypothetical protein RL375_4437 [Pseudomonadota bacterium]